MSELVILSLALLFALGFGVRAARKERNGFAWGGMFGLAFLCLVVSSIATGSTDDPSRLRVLFGLSIGSLLTLLVLPTFLAFLPFRCWRCSAHLSSRDHRAGNCAGCAAASD